MKRDPIRLRDDPRSSDYCRELLYLGGDPPPEFDYDVSCGLERFQVTVRSETVRASARVRRVPRTWIGRASVRVPVYALISGFAAVAFGGSAVWIQHRRAVVSLSPPAEETPEPEAQPRPRTAPRVAPQAHEAAMVDVPEIEKPKPPAPKVAASRSGALEVRAEGAHEDLTQETADIARLRTVALSDPARALALAQDAARRFPQGFFSQEREAIAIRALVKLGRVNEARARAERFLTAYPRGPAAESIRASVGLSPP